MEHIWAPWRIEYILQAKDSKTEGCILCQKSIETEDEANLILHRGKNNFIILNAYPYNPGHLMVAPYRHIGKLEDLNSEESIEHFLLIKLSIRLLKSAIEPSGFNTGMNLGRVAGAGIEDHIHTHVVPRWQGDTNFMSVLADTKVLPQALATSYTDLKKVLKNLI